MSVLYRGILGESHEGSIERRLRLALAGLPWLLATRPSAALTCDDIPLPNKVFGSGGSKITSTLKRVALATANDPEGTPAEQTTIFYTDPNTCDGFSDFLSGTSTRVFKYWVAGQTADQTCEARVGWPTSISDRLVGCCPIRRLPRSTSATCAWASMRFGSRGVS